MVPTGVATACQPDTVLQIWPRSGLAVKYGIEVLAGVVDSGYRNEVCVMIKNSGLQPFVIRDGDRIAQTLPVQLKQTNLLSFVPLHSLPSSERGTKGFGSSGV